MRSHFCMSLFTVPRIRSTPLQALIIAHVSSLDCSNFKVCKNKTKQHMYVLLLNESFFQKQVWHLSNRTPTELAKTVQLTGIRFTVYYTNNYNDIFISETGS